MRQAESKPLVADLRLWFEAQIAKLPARGPTAAAIRYALNHWDGLARFLEDGRIELDTNTIERAMRPVCLSRKNSLFAGSDEGGANWANLASLIETALCRARHRQVYAECQTMPNNLRKPFSVKQLLGNRSAYSDFKSTHIETIETQPGCKPFRSQSQERLGY